MKYGVEVVKNERGESVYQDYEIKEKPSAEVAHRMARVNCRTSHILAIMGGNNPDGSKRSGGVFGNLGFLIVLVFILLALWLCTFVAVCALWIAVQVILSAVWVLLKVVRL
jgi:hypothetical protein